MKFIFAAGLVLLALVAVFHVEKVIPIPRTVGCVVNSAVVKHMPFGIQAAYAESCVSGLEGEQDRVRYTVSDAAVRLNELDRRTAGLRQALACSAARIRAMVQGQAEVSDEILAKEVARHDDLQWKLTRSEGLQDHLAATLESLESSEGDVTQKLVELNDRLDIVKIDHEHNNARELAAELADSAYPNKRTHASHCSRVIEHMEHKERVREEVSRRYGPDAPHEVHQEIIDPWERAREIIDQDG